MSGNLKINKTDPTIHLITNEWDINTSTNNGLSVNTSAANYNIKGNTGQTISRLYTYGDTDGSVVTRFGSYNMTTAGNIISNRISSIVTKSGNRVYEVEDSSAFRAAIASTAFINNSQFSSIKLGDTTFYADSWLMVNVYVSAERYLRILINGQKVYEYFMQTSKGNALATIPIKSGQKVTIETNDELITSTAECAKAFGMR